MAFKASQETLTNSSKPLVCFVDSRAEVLIRGTGKLGTAFSLLSPAKKLQK